MEMDDGEAAPRAAIVAFYRFVDELPANASWQTHVFRWLFKQKCPNYEHCQLTFTHGFSSPGDFLKTTFTTTAAHPFANRNVRYRNQNWECYEIVTTPEHRTNLMHWCRANESTPFNTAGFYWNFFAPCTACAIDKRGSAYFCAEMVLTGLRRVLPLQALWDTHAYLCTVDDLHRIVKAHPDSFRPYGLRPFNNLVMPTDGPPIAHQSFSYPTPPVGSGVGNQLVVP